MGRSPAFQCYAKDLYTGTSDLSAAEFGSYWRGICWSWDNGPLPLQPEPRRRALMLDRGEFKRIWPKIRGLWTKGTKGYTNRRLEHIRKEQDAYREKQAEKGRKRHSRGSATAEPVLDSGSGPAGVRLEPEGSPPICDLRSATSKDQKQDQDQRANARDAYHVIEKLAHLVFTDVDEGLLAVEEVKDELKLRCAQANIAYDSEWVGKALSSAEHQRRTRRLES